jgi:hypothetical protein
MATYTLAHPFCHILDHLRLFQGGKEPTGGSALHCEIVTALHYVASLSQDITKLALKETLK